MKRVNITEVKNKLSAFIAGLRSGDGVLILDRGRPVARLEPVRAADLTDDDLLAELIRDGIVVPGCGHLPKDWFRNIPRVEGVSLTAALLEERREGR